MRAVRAQSAVEYLFIVVLALTLILPASFLFFDFSKSSEDSIISSQFNMVGNEILTSAEEVYVIGNTSRVTLEFVLPDVIQAATIYGEQELVIDYYTQAGLSQVVFFTDVNITNGTHRCIADNCSLRLTPGQNAVRITSRGDHVSIVRS
ncbi:hypothetical protein JXA12_01240 [Candidatus Woesearchaeota archaeon]|nr:hypothetical protein [Candidatus Woesearchaeota archaeon]